MDKITANTVIPISLLITLLSGFYWLFGVAFQTSASAQDIKYLKKEMIVLNKINNRLSRIEGALDIKSKDSDQ